MAVEMRAFKFTYSTVCTSFDEVLLPYCMKRSRMACFVSDVIGLSCLVESSFKDCPMIKGSWPLYFVTELGPRATQNVRFRKEA